VAYSLQDRACDRKQAVVRERHETATVDIAGVVEMLLFHPERTADLPVRFGPVPERPGMGLMIGVQVRQPLNSPAVAMCRSGRSKWADVVVSSKKMGLQFLPQAP
jgi:hypothetical protein